MTTGINFDKLWADKKYQALHARKSKLWTEYVAAYVDLMHYAERLVTAASTSASHGAHGGAAEHAH